MRRRSAITWSGLVAGLLLASTPHPAAQDGKASAATAPVSYSALAVQTTATPAVTVPIQISVERWSTPAERAQLMTTLREQGADQLLETLKRLPEVGRLTPTGGVGVPVHFASRQAMADGSVRVGIATDRWVGLAEAMSGARSLDYPFTLIELRLGPDGTGEGRMSYATRISFSAEPELLTLENYDQQPIVLQGVRRIGD